jgi:hypothetical protein
MFAARITSPQRCRSRAMSARKPSGPSIRLVMPFSVSRRWKTGSAFTCRTAATQRSRIGLGIPPGPATPNQLGMTRFGTVALIGGRSG